jgi:hypothetical protein
MNEVRKLFRVNAGNCIRASGVTRPKGVVMRTLQIKKLGMLAGLAVALGVQTGCQTQIAGMTLPSPYYMEHPPQYFPEDPAFPLIKELATQEEQAGLIRPRDAGAANVAPIPGAAGPVTPATPAPAMAPAPAQAPGM